MSEEAPPGDAPPAVEPSNEVSESPDDAAALSPELGSALSKTSAGRSRTTESEEDEDADIEDTETEGEGAHREVTVEEAMGFAAEEEYGEDYFAEGEWAGGEEDIIPEEEEEPFVSVFERLDAPRVLAEPVDLTMNHLKQVALELGLIRLCWPDIKDPFFDNRTNFPESYLKNTNKEKLLLFYAENFRRQFHHKYPHRKPLFLAATNECGQQKMVCTTLRPTRLPHTEIEQWNDCAAFVGDHIIYDPLEAPTLIPDRLYSPHSVFLRKAGHSYEIANALCSLLLGQNYNAYLVSGYAVRDITLKIMTRTVCPFPEEEEKTDEKEEEVLDPKYTLKPPRDLRSKFLMQMQEKQKKKVLEKQRLKQEEIQRQIAEQEKPPFDELHGLRLHAWILMKPGKRGITDTFFIEPGTGYRHEIDSESFCGIESVWNHENYWVNLQDCSEGIKNIEFDFDNVQHWEHLLVGEPILSRKMLHVEEMDEDELHLNEIMQEKHLDMPIPWSMAICIPHDVIETRFPTGIRTTCYKRTLVEEFAPYVQEDGLTVRICRFYDLDCSPDQLYIVEERYENRQDHLIKIIEEMSTSLITEYFSSGREDAAKVHKYSSYNNEVEAERTMEFYNKSRFDSMSKLELHAQWMVETYVDREDFFAYRQVKYAKRGHPPPGIIEGPRRIVLNLLEKFNRNFDKKASDDIATREFAIIDKEIHLKFHYDKGKVTASTRDFIKPPMAEMGDRLTFNPEMTSGYQAEIGTKPIRQLNLFNLLEQQMKEEEESLRQVREIEDQVAEFVRLRDLERAMPKLVVSIFNREENKEYKKGMLEREQQAKEHREREVEEETDFLSPYLIKVPKVMLTKQMAANIKESCLNDFKQLLVNRANDIQQQFESCTAELQRKQAWYTNMLDTLTLLEEENYFKELNNARFHLHTLELRLARHRDLSGPRYEALSNYLDSHPALTILRDDSSSRQK